MPIIDRIEENWAVIELQGNTINVPLEKLPREAREGDVVICSDGRWIIDVKATEEKKLRARRKLDKLWEK
ncbi:MAG TPA: DUF3006 domain-containing protein [Syntrophomonadaceae bacterium]|nr:DUF3006 domain-containing protein [Syntrophomonadaceae bacterium]